MVCRLWANEKNLADALRLGEYVKAQIKSRVGEWLHCSVGLGVSPFLAKVAAEMQKPNGLAVLDDEDLPHKLFGLKLRDFPGIGPRMEARLNAAGIHTTEQMYAVDCDRMRRLWGGVGGERWWRMLRGETVALPPPQRRSLGHSHVLPPDLRTPRGAAAVARRLLEKAAERLRHNGWHARGMSVYARSEDGREWCRKARFAPCRDTWMLMGLLRSFWEHPFPNVRQVGVVLHDLLPGDAVTPSLFDDRERFNRAALAVDEPEPALRARLGDDGRRPPRRPHRRRQDRLRPHQGTLKDAGQHIGVADSSLDRCRPLPTILSRSGRCPRAGRGSPPLHFHPVAAIIIPCL